MRDRLNEDPLAAIVALLRPRTVLSKFVSGAGQWAVQYPDFGHPSFGLMTAGRCWLQVADEAPFEMCAGDYVLLPATPGFRMGSDLAALERPIVRVADPRETRELRHGTPAQEPAARMLGGYFLFDPTSAPLLVGLLPTVVHIRAATSGSARLAWIARAIGEEATEGLPGSDAILTRLAEVMLIEALRWRPADGAAPPPGLLAGLADARLAVALRHVHEDGAPPSTIQSL